MNAAAGAHGPALVVGIVALVLAVLRILHFCRRYERIEDRPVRSHIHQDEDKKYFKSRIGNLVDAWYFGSLGSAERRQQFAELQMQSGQNSFGSFLKLDDALRHQLPCSTVSELVIASDAFWAVYDYNNIALCIYEFQQALEHQMVQYANLHRPELLRSQPYDCIIHYRIGDFLALGQLIDPQSVADACTSLHPQRIGLMDGGMSHNADEATRRDSLKVKNALKRMLQKALPNTRVDDCPAGDPDTDFFICARSPMLVTAGGSFAICAAIANHGIVRTPACENTNFCQTGSVPVREMRPGWTTYAYKRFDDAMLSG
jgi:hypothetical protein